MKAGNSENLVHILIYDYRYISIVILKQKPYLTKGKGWLLVGDWCRETVGKPIAF